MNNSPRIRLFIGERVFLVEPLEPMEEMPPARLGWISVSMGGQSFMGRLEEVDAWQNPEVLRKWIYGKGK